MPDWLITYLGSLQGGIVRTLAAEMRAGGLGTAWLALWTWRAPCAHARPREGSARGLFSGPRGAHRQWCSHRPGGCATARVSGFAAFVVLRFFVGQAHSITGRGSPTFTVLGYGLIIVAGAVMLFQSVRPASAGHDGPVLTGGIGLLPCPLTISVLGFAWVQGTAIMVMVVLAGLRARDRDHDRDCRRGDDPGAPHAPSGPRAAAAAA